MKIMYIQFAGDFSEAYTRLFKNDGNENYYGQKYSVGAVIEQVNKGAEVLVLTTTLLNSITKLQKGLTSVGVYKKGTDYYEPIFREIEGFSPDHVILRMPDYRIMGFLRRKKISVFPVFADSFEHKVGIRGWFNRKLLSRELRNHTVLYVANHQINSSKSLALLGVKPNKILPYDWVHDVIPDSWQPNINVDLTDKKIELFYAGNVTEQKGVYDLIRAIKIIIELGRDVSLKIAGAGDIKSAAALAESVGVMQNIDFMGCIDHQDILKEMNAADAVVVPSRHAYPEGLPMTIMESLLVQTPVIVSDHPMFVGRLSENGAVEFFQEKDFQKLAKKIIMVCSDVETYKLRCSQAKEEWYKLNLELKWADMINRWIDDSNDPYLKSHTLERIVNS